MGTARYLAWRVASMLVTVLIGAAAVFFAMKAAPGDPALAALGESASPEAVAAFRRRYNLDAPLLAAVLDAGSRQRCGAISAIR